MQEYCNYIKIKANIAKAIAQQYYATILRGSIDQIDAVARNESQKDLGIGETSSGHHKFIIGSSNIRMSPRTREPWEHNDAHLLKRRDMTQNSKGKGHVYRRARHRTLADVIYQSQSKRTFTPVYVRIWSFGLGNIFNKKKKSLRKILRLIYFATAILHCSVHGCLYVAR